MGSDPNSGVGDSKWGLTPIPEAEGKRLTAQCYTLTSLQLGLTFHIAMPALEGNTENPRYGPATGRTPVTKYSVSPKHVPGMPTCCL